MSIHHKLKYEDIPLAPGCGTWNVGSGKSDSTLAMFGLNALNPHIVRDETTRTRFRIASWLSLLGSVSSLFFLRKWHKRNIIIDLINYRNVNCPSSSVLVSSFILNTMRDWSNHQKQTLTKLPWRIGNLVPTWNHPAGRVTDRMSLSENRIRSRSFPWFPAGTSGPRVSSSPRRV